VAVNSAALTEIASASGGEVTEEDLKTRIQEAVNHAIGSSSLSSDANDLPSITANVSFVPFASMNSDELVADTVVNFKDWIPYGLMLLALLLFFFVLVRPIVSSVTTAFQGGGKRTPFDGLSDEEITTLKSRGGEDSNAALARRLQSAIEGFEPIDAQELNKLVQMHDQPSAEVVRRWLRA
jgi:flagellar biosynthesis/type III secretory pathway M-ring protein FliF/YscJ